MQVETVFALGGGLLGEVVGRSPEIEQGVDEVLFGLDFVGAVVAGEVLKEEAGGATEGGKEGRSNWRSVVERTLSVKRYSVNSWLDMGLDGLGIGEDRMFLSSGWRQVVGKEGLDRGLKAQRWAGRQGALGARVAAGSRLGMAG